MRTLTNTPLFGMFASYMEGPGLVPENLPAAYDDFADLLAALPQDGDRIRQLRRLNYARLELSFMRQACSAMSEGRHILYDVFINKTLSHYQLLLSAGIILLLKHLIAILTN